MKHFAGRPSDVVATAPTGEQNWPKPTPETEPEPEPEPPLVPSEDPEEPSSHVLSPLPPEVPSSDAES